MKKFNKIVIPLISLGIIAYFWTLFSTFGLGAVVLSFIILLHGGAILFLIYLKMKDNHLKQLADFEEKAKETIDKYIEVNVGQQQKLNYYKELLKNKAQINKKLSDQIKDQKKEK